MNRRIRIRRLVHFLKVGPQFGPVFPAISTKKRQVQLFELWCCKIKKWLFWRSTAIFGSEYDQRTVSSICLHKEVPV